MFVEGITMEINLTSVRSVIRLFFQLNTHPENQEYFLTEQEEKQRLYKESRIEWLSEQKVKASKARGRNYDKESKEETKGSGNRL